MSDGFTSFVTEDGFICIEQRGVRCFLFIGEKEALLVDCAFEGDLKSYCETLTDKPIRVVITHADGDHTGGAEGFDRLYMHPAEFDRYYEKNSVSAAVPAAAVWENSVIDLGKWQFEVVLIPGHTPGGIALLEREKRFLIGGDTIQSGAIFMAMDGRNMPAFLASMEKLQQMRGTFDKIYASHNNLIESPDVINDLESFARDVLAGNLPEPVQPEDSWLPPQVKLFSRGKAHFLLDADRTFS
jgi:glyoxylase-like metal-dependent hydrolase (beta-lactamase superfamily II)